MKKSSFLFITDTDYESGKLTGAHRRFLELIKGFSRSDNVVLISRRIPELSGCNVRNIVIKDNKKTLIPSHINKIIKLRKVLRAKKGEINYDYAISFGPVDTFCYKSCGYGNIVTLFREDYLGYKRALNLSPLKLQYFKTLEKYAVKHSDRIIVQCNDDKKALVMRYGKKDKTLESKVFVQVNNINASWMPKRHHVNKKMNNNGEINIAFIGCFSDNRKGHHLLLPAIKQLIADGYNIKLMVAGDGAQLKDYKSRYKELRNIVFLGRVQDTSELLSKSDFEIVPSLMDSCPNTVLEGINAGIAVYGTNVGGIREILIDKDYLFNPTVTSIVDFLKRKIDTRGYIMDAKSQQIIKRRLTFDWSGKIRNIICQSMEEER